MIPLKVLLLLSCLLVLASSKISRKAQHVPLPLSETDQKRPSTLLEDGSVPDFIDDLPDEIHETLPPNLDELDRLALDKKERHELQDEENRRRKNQTVKAKEDCHPKVDLVFLLDTSGSIEQIYQEHVRWAVALVESLPIEQDTVRVAAVQYAGFPLTEFALGTYPNAQDIRQHLAQINFQSGVTRTGYALRKAEAELFRSDRGAREGAKKVIVLFTDGLSIDDPLKPAQQLRDLKGVVIYVVSVGNDGFELEMNRIAGGKDKVFGPNDLSRLRDALISEAERARACLRVGTSSSNRFAAVKAAKAKSSFGRPLVAQAGTQLAQVDVPLVNVSNVPLESQLSSATDGTETNVEDILSLSDDLQVEGGNETASANISLAEVLNASKAEPSSTVEVTSLPVTTSTTTKEPTSSIQTTVQKVQLSQRNSADADVFEGSNEIRQTRRPIPFTRSSSSTQDKTTFASSKKSSTTKKLSTTTSTTTTATSAPLRRRLHFTVRPQPLAAAKEARANPYPPAPVVGVGIIAPLGSSATAASSKRTGQQSLSVVPVLESRRITANTVKVSQRVTTETTSRTTTTARRTTSTLASSTTSRPRLLSSPNRRGPLTLGDGASNCPQDWLFVVDSSGSVQSVYDEQKAYLRDILDEIQLGSQAHRVALLQFAGSEMQKTEWSYDAFNDNEALMNAFNQVRHITGTTYIGAALESALHILESRRRQTPSVVVLLSDGFSQDDATKPAERLRKLPNSEFYALSISELSNNEYLTAMAGDSEHVFVSKGKSEELRRLLIDRLQCRRRP